MDLVDRHRAFEGRRLAPLREPLRVRPLVLRVVHDRRRLGRELGLERDRVGLQAEVAVGRQDLVLVAGARPDAGQEQLPHAGGAERAHRVDAPVPVVEVADDRHRPRGRRPDRERGPGDAVDLGHVRAEPIPQLLVAALAEQVHVELADRRQEAVRVFDRDRAGVAVADLELVGQRQVHALEPALEDAARVHLLERLVLAVGGDDLDLRGGRPERADHHRPVLGVSAQVRVRVGVLAGKEPVCVTHVRSVPSRLWDVASRFYRMWRRRRRLTARRGARRARCAHVPCRA